MLVMVSYLFLLFTVECCYLIYDEDQEEVTYIRRRFIVLQFAVILNPEREQ